MKKLLALLLVAVLAAGCATSARSPAGRPGSMAARLADGGAPRGESGRFLGHLSQAFEDHVRDCLGGLSFLGRSFSRGIAEDMSRLRATFR